MSGGTDATVSGAREGRLSGLRRLLARAAARDLAALVVPGPEVARALGLDLEATGLSLADGPRQASVLVIVGHPVGLPEGLGRSAEVAYAQMPRPRAVLAVGGEAPESLPTDASCEPDQESLTNAVGGLRRAFRRGAFSAHVEDFEAPALETRTIYTCSMHPEIEQDEPGQCPKCGMELISKESSGNGGESDAQHDHGDHEHGQDESGESGEETAGLDHTAVAGEGDHDEDGRGGHEETEKAADDGGGGEDSGEHEDMGHEDMDFMSMVEMTQGTPRSSDGLQMEWVEAPFGPLLPSLPGGLSLSFTLDGDTVAEAGVESATASAEALLYGPASGLVERLSGLDPLSPVSYRLLASLALQDASEGERRRLAVLEVERAASHLGWLSGFAHLNGLEPVRREAARLELRLRRLPVDHLEHEHVSGDLLEAADRLARGIDRTPLLSRRLYGVGVLEARDTEMGGPVARAAGRREDLRLESADYEALGFEPVLAEGSDALSRMRVRLAELQQSLYLARDALRRATGSGLAPAYDAASGSGSAAVETPRGPATLWISIEGGEVVEAELIVPAQAALALAESVAEGRELGDALVGVASLDISPWGAG